MTARKDPSLKSDPVRKALAEQLRRNDLSMKHASTAIGRNPAYLHQYLTRGFPTVLGFRDSEKLAELLGCSAEALRHKTVPPRKPVKRKPRASPPPGAPHCPIPEVAVGAATGALDKELARETARWYLPEAMLRHEGGANPDNLKILKVRGNSMEPDMREGDRVIVDTARRQPAIGSCSCSRTAPVSWSSGWRRCAMPIRCACACSPPTPITRPTPALPRRPASSARSCGPSNACERTETAKMNSSSLCRTARASDARPDCAVGCMDRRTHISEMGGLSGMTATAI